MQALARRMRVFSTATAAALCLATSIELDAANGGALDLHECWPSPPGDAYPAHLMRRRLEAKLLLAVDLNTRGRFENFQIVALEGGSEFRALARKLLLGYRCKKPSEPRALRFSLIYFMVDGPGVSHYLESDDQITVTGSITKSR
jgi:hypothetical protein